MGVVVTEVFEPDRFQPLAQLALAVDAHVAALDLVVSVGQRPADLLRTPARDGHGDQTARAQHAGDLGHRRLVAGDVFEHLGDDHAIERAVCERQAQRVSLNGDAVSGLRVDLRQAGREPL